MPKPRILIPEPTSNDTEYNQRGWVQYAAAVEQAGGIPVAVVELRLTQKQPVLQSHRSIGCRVAGSQVNRFAQGGNSAIVLPLDRKQLAVLT